MENIILVLEHPKFDFREAEKVAQFYAKCNTYSISELSQIMDIDRKRITRCLKVAIVIGLVTDQQIDIIISKRLLNFNKYYKGKSKSVKTLEKCAELAEERKKLLKKLNFFKMMLKDEELVKERFSYIYERLEEIERYAFI